VIALGEGGAVMHGRANGAWAAVLVLMAAGCGGRPADVPAPDSGEKPSLPAASMRRVTLHVKDMT
jgi:hypothetical protein